MRISDLILRRPERSPAGREPPDPFRAPQADLDGAFGTFWRMLDPEPAGGGLGAMLVDVTDEGDTVTVRAELPGLTDADIEVTVGDGLLTIRGERKLERSAERGTVSRRERAYGLIERALPLPEFVDPTRAQATLENGILTVVLPKAEGGDEARRIRVQRD